MKKALIVRMDDALFAELAAHREKTGVPASEFVRRALRMALFVDREAAVSKQEK